jgi:hypothetical protein
MAARFLRGGVSSFRPRSYLPHEQAGTETRATDELKAEVASYRPHDPPALLLFGYGPVLDLAKPRG